MTDQNLLIQLEEKILTLLRDRRITQKEFAKLLGWQESKVSRVFKKDTELTFAMFIEACDALDIEPHKLIDLPINYVELRNAKGEWIGICRKDQILNNGN